VILAQHTGQNIEKIRDDTDRDYFMSGSEAVDYGLIDVVLDKRAGPVAMMEDKKD
jgi:ATP-dependent Clp protease protease subunit